MRLFEPTFPVSYTKTVLNWYNVTIDGKRYNVPPHLFHDIVYPSERTVCGVAELTKLEIKALMNGGTQL